MTKTDSISYILIYYLIYYSVEDAPTLRPCLQNQYLSPPCFLVASIDAGHRQIFSGEQRT
jgi:hypothetical protein